MTRITDLIGIKYPIFQGGMAWVADWHIAAAVSEAGGLGVLGPHAGQNSLPKDDVERAERMRKEIQKVKELTSKPFDINIFHSEQNPDIQLQLMLKVYMKKKFQLHSCSHRS